MRRPLWVVVVSGDPDTVRFWQEGLTLLGHDIAAVESGPELVELCQTLWPDLIVAEVTDGNLEAVRRVRQLGLIPVAYLLSRPGPSGLPAGASQTCVLTPHLGWDDLATAVALADDYAAASQLALQ